MLHIKRTPRCLPILGGKPWKWKQITRYVEKLQQRIYRAEIQGNKRRCRDLQRLALHSRAVLLLSIKRVKQTNKGKKTPGIDGETALTGKERMELYQEMSRKDIRCHKAKSSYRTYIKKKNGKLRPLSIPTIKDRIYQNIAKTALEPQWEARFEPTTYGFRPGRGCHDAVMRIYNTCSRGKKQWVFEGDFKGCLLVKDGVLSVKEAAQRMDVTEEAFWERMKKQDY